MAWRVYILYLASVATIASALVVPQQPLSSDTFDSAPISPFGYTKDTGPVSWYQMKPSTWSACAKGSNQSPINYDQTNATRTNVRLNIPIIQQAEIENLGNTIELNLTGMGTMQEGGRTYTLQQIHFHTPSEHHVNGQFWELEMHMVFKDGSDIAVCAHMFGIGPYQAQQPVLAAMLRTVEQVRVPGTISTTGPLDFTGIIDSWANTAAMTYMGSLTTPPCTEGVKWYMRENVNQLDTSVYWRLKEIQKYNARNLQNQYGGENLLIGAGKALKGNGVI